MVLSDENITKFQTIYKDIFGREISKEEAYEIGIKLIRLMSTIYKPMTKEEFEKTQEARKETLKLLNDY